MDKIPFVDGTKISNAKVTINEQEYEVTPAQYSGTTPVSAFNLNKMQDNIEKAIPITNTIKVSATEPKNKANIWFKHGKNLFNAVIEQGGISDLGADNPGNDRLRTLEFIFLKKGTYTLSFSGLEYSGGYLYNTNGTFIKLLWAWTTGNKTFTIENDSLMRFTFRKSDNAEITPDVVKNIQIEVGLEATEYEAPVEDDILVNNNGVYNSVLLNLINPTKNRPYFTNSIYKDDGKIEINTNNGTYLVWIATSGGGNDPSLLLIDVQSESITSNGFGGMHNVPTYSNGKITITTKNQYLYYGYIQLR